MARSTTTDASSPSTMPAIEPRLAVLRAADGAAPFTSSRIVDPVRIAVSSTQRLCGAVCKLLEMHRHTVEQLRTMSDDLDAQWLGVNTANTVAAGLAVAAAVSIFTAPPLALGFGIAAASSSSVTFAGSRRVTDRGVTPSPISSAPQPTRCGEEAVDSAGPVGPAATTSIIARGSADGDRAHQCMRRQVF